MLATLTILPYPLPGEAVILPVDFDGGIGDGEFHILPYPMPGDGEVTILPTFELTVARVSVDWLI